MRINIKIGDEIYVEDKLCRVTDLAPSYVYVRLHGRMKAVWFEELYDRKFEWVIEYKKNGNEGHSRTNDEERAHKEAALLETLGWKCRIFQREVK